MPGIASTHSGSEGGDRLKALDFLLGDWIGDGQGDTFTFHEEASFRWVLDERALAYHSRSFADGSGFIHCEEGYLMYANREQRLLGLFIYGDGLIELAEARLEVDGGLTLDTWQIIAVPRGKSYRSIHRRLTPMLEGFRHEIVLTLGPEGPFRHAESRLTRVRSSGLVTP